VPLVVVTVLVLSTEDERCDVLLVVELEPLGTDEPWEDDELAVVEEVVAEGLLGSDDELESKEDDEFGTEEDAVVCTDEVADVEWELLWLPGSVATLEVLPALDDPEAEVVDWDWDVPIVEDIGAEEEELDDMVLPTVPGDEGGLEGVDDELEEVELALAGALVEPELSEAVDDGGTMVATSTGHTSASMPPIVKAVQLPKGAVGKPA
jgi:hypothetical protein